MNKYMSQNKAVKEWTPMQAKFVQFASQGLDPTEAARQAGYADPHVDGCKLLADTHIRTAIMRGLRRKIHANIGWKELIEEAKQILHLAMQHGDIKEAVTAASKCLDVATKIGEETLASKAAREDRVTSIQEEAEKSLGKMAVVVIPDEEQDAVEH